MYKRQEIIFGTTLNEELEDKVIFTVIATGIDSTGFNEAGAAKKPEVKAETKEVEEKAEAETEEKAASQPEVVSYIDNNGEKVDLDIDIPSFLRRKKM